MRCWLAVVAVAFAASRPVLAISMHIIDTSVSCDQKYFVLNIRFEAPFQGAIYSEKGLPNCVYVNASLFSQTFYSLKVPLDGCETTINGDGNFENAVIIQSEPNLLRASDKKFLLTCVPIPVNVRNDPSNISFGSVTVQGVSDVSEWARSVTRITNTQYSVQLLSTPHGTPIDPRTTSLIVGDPVTYVVRVSRSWADSRIGRCWATDTISSLELSDDWGCTLQPDGDVWNQFEREVDDSEIVFRNRIKAWAFPTSNEVSIFCNLHTCRGVCETVRCASRDRDRRRADSGDDSSSSSSSSSSTVPFAAVHVLRHQSSTS